MRLRIYFVLLTVLLSTFLGICWKTLANRPPKQKPNLITYFAKRPGYRPINFTIKKGYFQFVGRSRGRSFAISFTGTLSLAFHKDKNDPGVIKAWINKANFSSDYVYLPPMLRDETQLRLKWQDYGFSPFRICLYTNDIVSPYPHEEKERRAYVYFLVELEKEIEAVVRFEISGGSFYLENNQIRLTLIASAPFPDDQTHSSPPYPMISPEFSEVFGKGFLLLRIEAVEIPPGR